MKRPLNWGLIGVGGMGGAHLATIEKLEAEGSVRLACVTDPFVEKLAETKSALDRRQVRWYTDYAEMLGREADLDAVSICTPIHLHYPMTKAAIDHGVFVYLEKPPVPMIQQLDDLLTRDRRRRTAVGFQMIGSPLLRQLKQWKVDGALGEVKSIRATAAWPRHAKYYQRASWAGKVTLKGEPVFDGPATNANAHLIHAVMFLAGDGIDDFGIPVEIEGEMHRARPIESYDTACLRGRVASGTEVYCVVSHATQRHVPFRIEVIGSKGRAWIADNGQNLGDNLGLTRPPPTQADVFLESYRAFRDFALGERPRPFTWLADTRGYVLATNGMWIASDGIRTIPGTHHHTYGHDGESGYDVNDLADWIERGGREAKLFSETGLPWAQPGRKAPLTRLKSFQFG